MDQKVPKKINWKAIVFFLSLIALALVGYFIQNSILQKNHRYTVAWITKIRGGYKFTTITEFEFKFNGEIYTIQGPSGKLGEAYIVKFYPPWPNNCQIQKDMLLPDGIIKDSIPDEGWESLDQIKLYRLTYP